MDDVITLADYRARPQTTTCDFTSVMTPTVIQRYTTYRDTVVSPKLVRPEDLAIEFYLLNAAAAEIAQSVDHYQPLTVGQHAVLDTYYQSMEKIGHRIFFYLLLICTRESRHCISNSSLITDIEPLGALPFWKTLKGTDSMEAIEKLLGSPPTIELRNYTQHLWKVFLLGGKPSGGFAGPKWAAIAKPLNEFTQGVITMEMLLDTAWTLEHNNGAMFNKGMLFHHQNGSELQKILDVQRSGQIPGLVAFTESDKVTKQHLGLLELCRGVLPDFGSEAVNWQKVQELGAVGHYVKLPPKAAKIIKPKPFPSSMTTHHSKVELTNHFQVTTNEFVKKIARKDTK
jgi:hypothetical protein